VLSLGLTSCTAQPKENGAADATGALTLSREVVVFGAGGDLSDDTRSVQVTNTGTGTLKVSATLTGEDAAQFTLQAASFNLGAGQMRELAVTFTPVAGDLGPQHATLNLSGGNSPVAASLGGLHVEGQNGLLEPSLQWIFETYGFPLQTGDGDPTTSPLVDEPANYPLGDEVAAQTFVRADPTQPVTVQVLAAFAVPDVAPVFEFGYYGANNAKSLQQLLGLPIIPALNGQQLEPVITPVATEVLAGVVSFIPAAEPFGFYSVWPTTRFFETRTVYTEDARNTFDTSPHHVRAYPLPLQNGETVYVLATDESNRLNDFNDAVLLVRNVRPVASE